MSEAPDEIPAGSDDEWLAPWLRWLEEVENRSGIRDFGPDERGEHCLEELHAMFIRNESTEAGADWLTAHITTGAPI